MKSPRSLNPDPRYWSPERRLPDYLLHEWTPEARYSFIEVKAEKSSLSTTQRKMFEILKKHFDVYIFRIDLPEDLEIRIQMKKTQGGAFPFSRSPIALKTKILGY